MITQETFDTIYRGLAAQGWQKSYDYEVDLCRYRNPDGLKCAIGQLIDDDRYTQKMDSMSGSYILGDFHKIGMLLDLTYDDFQELQQSHDNSDGPDDMRSKFEELAGKYGLTVPVLP